ncbi:MAG: nitrilase-related carbon-nitrogen hydrolase [Acidiferrobacteraceae bacterium]|jgi:apolipoprotein N-acyltransferase
MDILAKALWLLLGSAIQLLGFGRWMTPLAAWLAPVFLLHFAHGLTPAIAMLWIWLSLGVAMGISLRGIVPIPGIAYLVLPITTGLLGALPFLFNGLVAPHVPGFWATLVFPVALTAIEFLEARLNPYGTWGATGYTQHGVLPLMQLASVTGVWGIGFLVAWFAAVVNWAWDRQFAWDAIQYGVLIFAGVAGAIFLLGGLRIALAPARKTVRIAGVGWPKGILEREEFMPAVLPGLTTERREKLRQAFARVHDSFFLRSEREARAGARVIVWPEANLMVFEEDESAVLERARGFAREHGVHLVLGMATVLPGERYTFRNHAVLVTAAGETLFDYTKFTSVPGFEKKFSVPGDRAMPIVDTEFGRFVSPICFDMDFDGVVNQVGRGRADLMLVPASDWKDIIPIHQQMAEFRAIENGTALFRITRWGASGAIDPYGRTLASMDDFSAEDAVMVANVPVRAGVGTVFSRVGNLFGWACVAGLAAQIGVLALRAIQ